uniref:Uncharacterized protein n=1 Tax=Salix viminalis TaxID=40686 RepID=A0A6N2LZK5_SALVM
MPANTTSSEISLDEHGTAGKSWKLLAPVRAERKKAVGYPFDDGDGDDIGLSWLISNHSFFIGQRSLGKGMEGPDRVFPAPDIALLPEVLTPLNILEIHIHESTTKREKEMEEDAGMSKNAQFRAIQPSTSILSYVEDDFRGRRRLIELKRAGYNTDLSTPLDSIPFPTSSERERIEENGVAYR